MSVPYTKQVAYLESAGSQWIDTGVVPTSTTRIELQYQYSTGNYTSGCGVCANGGSKRFHINTYLGKLHFGSGGSSNWVNTIDQNTNIHSASLSGTGSGNVLIDGNTYSTNGTVGDFTGYNIYLFRVNGESSYTNGYRIYYCKIYDNNVLVRDFIPVRIGNEGCLYDNVSGELFRNKGTGNFIFNEILEHSPLISNIRRRLLYAKPKGYNLDELGYISDGQEIHLDAIYNDFLTHNSNADRWYDYVSKDYYQLNGDTGYIWNADNIVTTNTTQHYKKIMDHPFVKNLYTVSLLFRFTGMMGYDFGDNKIRHYYRTIVYNSGWREATIFQQTDYVSVVKIDFVLDNSVLKCYKNGELIQTWQNVTVLTSDTILIGSGCWYNVKVYNRPLSEKEIKFNYNVDVNRFGL